MVTATRIATQTPWFVISQWLDYLKVSSRTLMLTALITAVLLSAVSVVYVRCLERQLVSTQQSLVEERQSLQDQWGQLLLERSTWSNPVHIQQVATDQGMITPQQQAIIMVRS